MSDQPEIEDCGLCQADQGRYEWSRVCCRARFVTKLPGIDWRRGWMARWKERDSSEFYDAIARAVKVRWENKKGDVAMIEVANG